MYKNWKNLLHVLAQEGYTPDLISTKVPLSKAIIKSFQPFHIHLQISVDSLSSDIAQKMLHVNDTYAESIQQTLKDVNGSGIRFQIATVLTNINDNIENLQEIATFIKTLNKLERWEIRVAFRSLYSKADFDNIKSTRKQITKVKEWIDSIREDFPIEILWSPDEDEKYKKDIGGSANFKGPICSANMTNMVILPNGEVSICEQLYWNKNFIIGNVCDSSIKEIWSSPKALGLWKREQGTVNPQSPCRTCADFSSCFEASNRCHANIMKAYGRDNFDFPDPRCTFAPHFKNIIAHE